LCVRIHLRRGEQPPAAIPKATVAGERGMLCEPAGDRGRGAAVAVAGRDFFCGRFQRVAAIVQRECFQDFRQWIGFIAHCPWAWGERATARATAIERNILQFFLASAFFDEAFAIARRETEKIAARGLASVQPCIDSEVISPTAMAAGNTGFFEHCREFKEMIFHFAHRSSHPIGPRTDVAGLLARMPHVGLPSDRC
jgi:hypothetical protein